MVDVPNAEGQTVAGYIVDYLRALGVSQHGGLASSLKQRPNVGTPVYVVASLEIGGPAALDIISQIDDVALIRFIGRNDERLQHDIILVGLFVQI